METSHRFTLVSIHTMDPRGSKVGGIETHIRHLLKHHPRESQLVMVGIDERGDLPLGRFSTIDVEGRHILFLPLMRVDAESGLGAAASLSSSLTLRFAAQLTLALPHLRRRLKGARAVVEVERVELALPAKLLGHPLIVLLHNEGQRGDKMDSILGRHWWIHEGAEWVAVRLCERLYCVTEKLRQRLAARHPAYAGRIDVRTVSVDRDIFQARPFSFPDDKLRILFAGRLDAFKDPAMMFDVAARLHRKLGGAFEFHYCGASDPQAFSEFAAIAACTICHGALKPQQVAGVMEKAHFGILTSFYEGMPCFLLELLASGRPFAGLHLPQFEQVVKPGISGAMTARQDDRTATAEALSTLIISMWEEAKAGRYQPHLVADQIASFSVTRQLADMFSFMNELAVRNASATAHSHYIAAGE